MSQLRNIKVAIIAFMDDNGRIMLNKRADADSEMWELIGGGIEADETPEDAIRREVSEEIGYTIDDAGDNLVFHREFTYSNSKFSATVFCFTASFPGFENFSDSDETAVADLELVSLEEARQRVLLPMTKIVVDEL